jgi:hypothetical protein
VSQPPSLTVEKAWGIVNAVWLAGVAFAAAVWIYVVGVGDLGLGWWFKSRALDARRLEALTGLCALSLLGLQLVRPRLEQWEETLRGLRLDAHRAP